MIRDPAFLADVAPHKPRPKRETCEKHLRFVAGLPCCICRRAGDTQVHHLLRGVVRGMGMKAADRHVIPVCTIHHAAIHAHGDEAEFLALRNIDGPALAAALWSVSGDHDEAVRIMG
jgi:hypothetical protein